MNQRKLTDDERLVVGSAVHFLYQVASWSGGTGDCWRNSLRQLNEMLNHGTTDGCQIDRIPTDEDARSRPEVMVRDRDDQPWLKRKLICVMPKKDRAFIVADDYCVNSWQQCRYPYLGE